MNFKAIFLLFCVFLMCLMNVDSEESTLTKKQEQELTKIFKWQQKVDRRCKRLKKNARTLQGNRKKFYKRFCKDLDPTKLTKEDKQDYDYS